ncbi:hypothetical protein [Thermogemmatispora tikiterensis]|uniref:Cytochrome b561 domain-containing protein n=1 Tax=Thermogemmatispora tikiterensis TaxID=1825093 RepID=A0A328VKI1_9CHLR|nr:hypothetical protein [Thermogemmatispora tikiterensis]RAQ96053.1 hypothetical protein A4R35_10960 [Thermogemmatispora tikiterensis]
MAIKIASFVLRIAGLLALILGVLFWTGNAAQLVPLHMLLGFVVVLALWVVGIGQALVRGGSPAIAVLAVIVGLLLPIIGLMQNSWLLNSSHWIIQVVHLLVALLAIGTGEMGAARYRRASAGVAAR